ncbi:MAG TPA: ATP-binding protein [Epulopiscium sp.]|nr:ATP-binding protein [Candidatus Epulonipiscium sp.]
MPMLCNSKHVFPGSNTPSGFYSYYDNIISQENANKIFIIKGGPGTGKSSFMKKIANHFADQKIDVEYHHCSADPGSLDAIVIVPAGVAIIDGTFPHVVDTQAPGAIDEIINFSPYWNEKEIRSNKSMIIQTNANRKSLFSRSYCYLGAAKQVYDAYAKSQSSALNHKSFYNMEQSILENIFEAYMSSNPNVIHHSGHSRHLFGSAITPDGFIDHLHTIIGKTKRVYTIKDAPGASASNLMNLIVAKSIGLGLDIECFHSPISYENIEDIIIPKLDIAITVSNDYHKAKIVPTHVFDLKGCFIANNLAEIAPDLTCDKALMDQLFNRGIATLLQAKEQHNILESYYIPHVRFDDMNPIIESVISQIESFLQ